MPKQARCPCLGGAGGAGPIVFMVCSWPTNGEVPLAMKSGEPPISDAGATG